jgi:hypothetical protein
MLPDAKPTPDLDAARMPCTRNSGSIRLVIVLDRDKEPIEGELIEPSACAQRFRGWLSLASLIESSRDHPASLEDLKPR